MKAYLIIAVFIFFVYTLVTNRKPKSMEKDKILIQSEEVINNMDESDISPYLGKYQKRYVLTKNEWYEYKKLKEYAGQKDLQVCPKIRLLDLIEPRKGIDHYRTYFYKIQAKHVDFVICDQNMYVKAIVELDDNSHNQEGRKERDRFIDTILQDVGYKVIRTRYISEDILSAIE